MRATKWLALALLSLGSLVLPRSAQASLVEALDLAALVDRSDDVVLVRVISSHSHFDDRGRIVTDVTMQVEQAEKGTYAPGSAVVVRHLGGQVGDLGMRVEGEPTYEVGETVLLFARHIASLNVLQPVGMSQGAMRVIERDGVRFVHSLAMGAALVKRGSGTLARALAAVDTPRKLDDVLSEIRALVKKK